jgi:biotin transport system substrate-specific component
VSAIADAVVRRSLGRSSLLVDGALVVAGSLIVAGLAQLSIRLPFTPVPISGQTLGVLLVGASLGAVRGGASVLAYLLEGAAGLPVFAEGKGGFSYLASADPLHTTGGYLWGFLVAAFVVGLLAERKWDRSIGSAIGAMLVGEVIIFAFGIAWLAAALGVPVEAAGEGFNDALEFGLYPFVVGEVVKLAAASALLPAAWRVAHRSGAARGVGG